MHSYRVGFAGAHVDIRWDTEEARRFLDFLLHDLQAAPGDDNQKTLSVFRTDAAGVYTLAVDGHIVCRGCLDFQFSAALFDTVIFHLLNSNNHGVALHAGAVGYQKQVILLPGTSGSGKSTLSAWLTAQGFSYLTDELILIPDNDSEPPIPFTRPFFIKSGSAREIQKLLPDDQLPKLLAGEQGIVVPHRILNPDFPRHRTAPALILFPAFQSESELRVEKLSPARICTALMACDVNGRNFADHGFSRIVRIGRSTPGYKITYSSFAGLREKLDLLLAQLHSAA
jgi:hypothetical protein